MGTLFRLCFLASLGLVVGWSGFFLVPSLDQRSQDRDDAGFCSAFPEVAREQAGEGSTLRVAFSTLSRILAGGAGTAVRGSSLLRRHLRVAGGFAPFIAVFSLASLLAGLIVRERLRLGIAYASPTSGFLAKRLVEGVSLALILWVLAPIPAPYWAIYPLALLGSLGLAAYVANLPLRL